MTWAELGGFGRLFNNSRFMSNSDFGGFPAARHGFVSEQWFSAIPSAEHAADVAVRWRTFWKANALEAVSAAQEGLRKDLSCLSQSLEGIDLSRRLDPRLVSRVAALMDAMSRGDGYAVYDGVQAWLSDPVDQWYADKWVVESVSSRAWEASIVKEIRSTRISGQPAIQCLPLLTIDLRQITSHVERALSYIREADPGMHGEIMTHVACIRMLDGSGMEGMSTARAFGAIWLRMPEPGDELGWFLEHLVHECSHIHLNALMAMDPLLLNPNEINQSPIRPDPRPMFQILHGTFVLFRNCQVHGRLAILAPQLGLEPALARFREQFAKGMEVLRNHARPTPLGDRLIQSMLSGQSHD